MIRDVFYYGNPPNVHPREKRVSSFEEAKALATTEHFWIINEFCDYRGFDWDFDFDTLPDEDVWAQDHINIWPSQWQRDSGTWLCSVESTDIVIYRTDVDPIKRKNEITDNWEDTEFFSIDNFDYSWHPDPAEPPFIYQFGTVWAKTHGPKYVVPGATDIKYVSDVVGRRPPDLKYWLNTDKSPFFDYSWHPDGTAPPYIYQFGTVLDENDGPTYVTPDNDGTIVYLRRDDVDVSKLDFPKYYIKNTLDNLIEEHPGEIFWALHEDIDYSTFDFSWRPTDENVYHINVFGSTESEMTQTYFVNGKMIEKGYKSYNYLEDKKLDEEYLTGLFKKMDMFYIDRGNTEANDSYEKLKLRFPNIQKTRYVGNWTDTIYRCINKSSTTLFWVLNSELDYTEFDFKYYPNPWQLKMIHVFGTQWSHWGTTYIINRDTFQEDTKYVKTIEHLSMLNFVKTKRANAVNRLYDIVMIDHGNKLPDVKFDHIVKYNESYLNTIKDLLKILPDKKEHYVWICSSICDYSKFDFTYICDPFTKEQLHVFPSQRLKFGDTFLMNVTKMREVIDSLTNLTDFKVNYNSHQYVDRLPAPVFVTGDSHAGCLDKEFDFPYAVFMTEDNISSQFKDIDTVNLWAPETKNILITHEGGTRVLVPKEATKIVKNELYDYPYIKTASKTFSSKPLDIVFFSNGETVADNNYEHLLKLTHKLPNKVKRIDKVVGRVASQHAAANISDTPWYFLINAKLRISEKFDFNWQPDRLQEPKHYIFTALNPVNQLEYGHMAIVANNKQLTLNTAVNGLDFTLASKHQSLDIHSGVAIFNTSELETWRTSFREVLKIKLSVEKNNDPASKYRLRNWLNVAEGDFAQNCLQGAKDAIEYYDAVNGDIDKLMLSYDWAWLSDYYNSKYK